MDNLQSEVAEMFAEYSGTDSPWGLYATRADDYRKSKQAEWQATWRSRQPKVLIKEKRHQEYLKHKDKYLARTKAWRAKQSKETMQEIWRRAYHKNKVWYQTRDAKRSAQTNLR